MSGSRPRRPGTWRPISTPWSSPMRSERRPHLLRLPALGLLVLLAGCSGLQSALDPAGPSAASIDLLGRIMYVGAALVALLVTALMLVPFLRRRERRVNRMLFLWGGGVAL